MVKPIKAEWDCDDSEKSDVYRLLNMVHVMAGNIAQTDKAQWWLKSCATYDDYVMTTWSNGIVDIRAETLRDGVNNPYKHIYCLMEALD